MDKNNLRVQIAKQAKFNLGIILFMCHTQDSVVSSVNPRKSMLCVLFILLFIHFIGESTT
jgi:hypothetical protein